MSLYQDNSTNKTTRQLYLEAFFISLMMLLLFWNEAGSVFPNVFNERDYLRVQEILSGKLILSGPELSRNGHIPGAFYYYLLTIPYALAGHTGPIFLMFLLLSLSFGFLWIAFEKKSWKEAFLFPAVLFVVSPVHKNLRDMAWNPSFVPFFWLCLLYFLYQFLSEEKKRERNWILFCVFSALSIQLHMSAFAWFILGQFLFWTKIKEARLWTKGSLVFILFFLPYGLWRLTHPAPNLGSQEAKALSSFLVFLQGLGQEFSLKQVGENLLFFFRWPMLAALVGSFIARVLETREQKKSLRPDLIFFLMLFLALVFILPVFIHRENPRYVLFPFFLAVLYIGFSVQSVSQKAHKIPLMILFISSLLWEVFSFRSAFSFFSLKDWPYPTLALIVLFSSFVVHRSKRLLLMMGTLFLMHQIYAISFLGRTERFLKWVPLHTMENLSAEIFKETGWTPAEMKKRVWWGGVLPEISMAYVYEDFTRKTLANPSSIDGVFVIHKRAWLYDLPLKVKVVKKKMVGAFALIFYQSKDVKLPAFIQNAGLPVAKASVYAHEIHDVERFRMQTFKEKENDVFLFYRKSSGELIFFSQELSRFYTLGPGIFIEKGKLRYLCDGKEDTLDLPDLGTSSGQSGADIYKGFAHPDSFFKSSIYTPLFYRMTCHRFSPLEFKASIIRKVIWGKKAGAPETLKDFHASFARLP